MSIERLSLRDVPDVVALHGEALEGLLSRLGPDAMRAYYVGCAEAVNATGLVARGSDGLQGFVLGSANPTKLRREVIEREPMGVLGGVALGVLRRPGNLPWLLKSLLGPDSGHYDSTVPELTYLAVRPTHRGHGVGRQLVAAFSDAMRAAGQTRFELSVQDGNPQATAFYERLGFTRVGEYEEFGQRHFRYEITLSPAPGTR
jgi:ribosomal protein S18 acetylase RimI-like enzyme